MKISKFIRATAGGIIMLVLTFAFLPALLINPDIEILQNFINYINKD